MSNRIIQTITEIESKLQRECGGLAMDDHEDRAQMAIWIYNNFIKTQPQSITRRPRNGTEIKLKEENG